VVEWSGRSGGTCEREGTACCGSIGQLFWLTRLFVRRRTGERKDDPYQLREVAARGLTGPCAHWSFKLSINRDYQVNYRLVNIGPRSLCPDARGGYSLDRQESRRRGCGRTSPALATFWWVRYTGGTFNLLVDTVWRRFHIFLPAHEH
jgi:hypothetical protein